MHASDAGPASDAGYSPPPPPPPASDAGPGFSLTPPGVDGAVVMAPPGCDASAGECAEWTSTLLDLVRARRTACGSAALVEDPRVVGIATRHAAYQASLDRIETSSPDGSLFSQITASGIRYSNVAVLFSETRDGPTDVMDRWLGRADAATYFGTCWGIAGASFATSSTGQSFVTLLFVQPAPL